MTVQSWDKSVEQLQSEASNLETLLKELKTATLSDADRKVKENQAKDSAEKLQWQVDKLRVSEWVDAKVTAERERAELLLKSCADTLSLQSSIWNKPSDWDKAEKKETTTQSTSTGTKPTVTWIDIQESNKDDEKKWFFWRTWDWIWEQWRDVRDYRKWQEEREKNWLRVGWFAVTWVWAIALAYKWIKSLFWKDKKKEEKSDSKESSDKKSNDGFWEKPIWKTIIWIWTGLWILTWGYYIAHWAITWNWAPRDMFDWSREKKLKFDDAMNYCKWAIANEKGLQWAEYDMNLQYHESTSEIEAYWEKIKIDKNSRKIEWLPVTFKTYEHMINTAIVIAFLKKNYSWMCSKKHPFSLEWSRTWNIDVNANWKPEKALDWTWKWWRITGIWGAAVLSIITAIRSKSVKVWASALTATWALWFIGWYAFDTNNPMSKHMPELDNDYWKMALAWYLNDLNCWEAKIQTVDDITDSPIKPEVAACVNELNEAEKELTSRWWRRKLDAVPDPNNPSKYIIKAYNREFPAEVSWEWNDKKIKLLWITWWSPAVIMNKNKPEIAESFFNIEMPLKEWIYLSSFLWYLLEDNSNCIRKWNKYPFFYYWKRFWLARPWIYFNDPSWNTYVLTEEKFQWRLPTVFNNKDLLLKFLNDWIVLNDTHESVRRDPKTLKKS